MSVPSQPERSQIGTPDGALATGATNSGVEQDTSRAPDAITRATEEIDALPVLADAATVVRAYPVANALDRNRRSPATVIPAVQAAAAAAGGFVAGAAVVGLVHRRHRHSAALSKNRRAGRAVGRTGRGGGAADRAVELVQIVGSRSLLVDVHLLGGRD